MLVVVSVVAGCQELFFNVVFFVEAAVCCLLAFCCCASVKVVYFLVLQTLKPSLTAGRHKIYILVMVDIFI